MILNTSEYFLVTFLISIVTFFCYKYLTQKKLKDFYKKFPHPPTLPLLGNALDFKSTIDVLVVFDKYKKLYGDKVHLRIGPFNEMLLISDYKFLEYLLGSNKLITKSTDYDFLLPWLGTGLLTSTGKKWKKHRKMLTPTFHFKILENFLDVFESVGQIMIKQLQKECGNSSVNIYSYITLCALDIICETAMGTKVNAQENKESEYIQSVKNMSRIVISRSISPYKSIDALFYFTEDYKIMKQSLKVLHGYTENVIKRKMEKLKNKQDDTSEISMTKNKKAFLDLLLEANYEQGEKLTFTEIREEVDTFMFEGHDTTATSMSFTVYCLANNPKVQQLAYEEQLNLFGNEKLPKVTYTDLQYMKYLENVIKESLRLYPSVPIFARHITEDTIDYNGEIIPKGADLTIFAYGIQKDPKYFPDPEVFNPSRFENIDKSLPYTFIPFSAGPRNCIGQKFAMLEMKSMISKLIRNFELLPANPKHELILAAETVLKSANGVRIGLRERTLL